MHSKNSSPTFLPSGARLFTLDAHYLQPEFAAVYLYQEPSPHGDRLHLIDCATIPSFEILKTQIQTHGFSIDQIQSLWITHVHLDHAGGASRWATALPHLKIYCHPRTAKHLAHPEKLIASASQVYGAETFNKLYGTITPIPLSQLVSLEDKAFAFEGGPQFLYTRGHANHHGCYFLKNEKILFSGDTFGLHYPALPFCLPSTSPTDFDAYLAIESIQTILSLHCDAVYPTHYGRVENLKEKADQLIEWLNWSEQWRLKAHKVFFENGRQAPHDKTETSHPQFTPFQIEFAKAYEERIQALLEKKSAPLPPTPSSRLDLETCLNLLKLDIQLNIQGVIFSARKGPV